MNYLVNRREVPKEFSLEPCPSSIVIQMKLRAQQRDLAGEEDPHNQLFKSGDVHVVPLAA